ncbi:MAG: hypothetical protein ACRENO_01405 [Thermodesulfobacteriota bacterium]
MNKKRLDDVNSYFKYFKILFESFEKNIANDHIGKDYKNEDTSNNKTKEFESYINNFLKEKLKK